MKTAKDEDRELLDGLPDEASLMEIQYHIHVRQKVQRGLEAERDGRTLTHEEMKRRSVDGVEQDNLILDECFTKQGYSSKDSEFGLVYVNGDNNLENLKAPDDTLKVRLIEEDFFRLMFESEGM